MRLKQITLHGFKSFAAKTVLDFSSGITSIVGPNGSGKSNISDALAWVMGEQSARTLRGANMQDVIFAGTAEKNPLSFAEITITIDNQAGELNVPYTDVVLSRKIFRSGESEYAINGNSCRLRDIHELLMDTGLGRDGYSIVGQGKIAEILSAKSDDRRQIFEEAAGISKYRYRREESQRKLASAEENLLRIGDIIGELESQLAPLERNSEKARKFLKLRDELKELEIAHTLASVHTLRSNQQGDEAALAASHAQEKETQDAINQIDSEIEQIYNEISEIDTLSGKRSSEQKQTSAELGRVRGEAQVAHNNIENAENNRKSLSEEISELEKRVADTNENETQSLLKSSENAVLASEREMNEVSTKMQNKQRILDDSKAKLYEKEREFLQKESRIKALADMERTFDGYGKSVKTIMQSGMSGIVGTIAQLFTVSPEYATAIDVALGGNAQNIVVQNEQTAKQAIAFLKQNSAGRATFLPLNSTTGNPISNLPTSRGVIGLASECVNFAPEFREIANNLLGRIVVVDTMDNAVEYSRNAGKNVRIVTLTGEFFSPGGAISGGSRSASAGIFSRASELKKLESLNQMLAADITASSAETDAKQAEMRELAGQLELLRETYSEKQQELALAKQKAALFAEQMEILKDGLRKKSQQSEQLGGQMEAHKQRRLELETQARELEAQLLNLEETAQAAFKQRRSLEEKVRESQEKRRELVEIQLDLQKETARLSVKHERAEVEIDAILMRMWEEYELTLSDMEAGALQTSRANELAFSQTKRPSESIKNRISALKSEIKSLGNVDIDSIENYKTILKRHEFLDGQRNDLVQAKANLEKIISDMTELMRAQFEEQFAVINAEFKKVFAQLFGGGTAKLMLTDPSNVLTSGIEISVQPPGKAVQNMQLLSGGEKALTAISLLLSLMKVRPAPFCVLDEIDAALDDANVVRYAQFLKEYSDKTQFVLITHKRGTMEASNVLYGVTMQEKGVSTVISLNLDEIVNDNKNDVQFVFNTTTEFAGEINA